MFKELVAGQKQMEEGLSAQLARLEKGQAQPLARSADIFEVAVRGAVQGVPRSQRGSTVITSLLQLLLMFELPGDGLGLAHAALAQPGALYAYRSVVQKKFGKAGGAQAATAAWSAATPTPSSEAEWLAEAALARQLFQCVVTNSQPHSAIRLWLSLCEAAAKDAASPGGGGGALLSLLQAPPAPLAWRADVALAAALAGGCQSEVELDLPVEVCSASGVTTILVEEVKSGGAGLNTARAQLRRVIMMVAWAHAVLQQPLPTFVGSVVVPRTERRKAERRLGRAFQERVPVPQGRGSVAVTWELSSP
ncbi:ABC transporter permease [Micractinium conductrix]|uniref:ABC transporter permease n=1 Tax=Micractinium conductrix TaxID=554055 RepID=A0A2P6VSB5_9CHLO|nr:ABC transporter permease [Micractinium conductrix]|eukprot:PSC76986.1 ABC transporter permease [Micractinium conductrix]